MIKFIPVLIFSFLMFLISNGVYGQSKGLPEKVTNQIENYKTNAFKNRNIGNDNAAASYLNKIAYLYWEYFIYDEANKYFEEVLTINQQSGNKHGEQKILDNMAFVYSDMERYDQSIVYFKKSLVLLEEFGKKDQIASCMSNVALAYSNNGQGKEAITIAEKGLEISKSLNNMKLIRSFYGILYECYEQVGEKEKSMEYFSLYSTMDKHIQQQQFQEKERRNKAQMNQIESEKNLAIHEKEQTENVLIQTKDTLAEVEQISQEQELKIDLLNVEAKVQNLTIEKQEASLKAKKRLIYFMILIFVLIGLFVLYVLQQMKIRKKANQKLQELYNEIEKKNNQILDSINYASHIQEAILPYEQALQEQIPESFIFYKPRDIVSGDFYWYAQHGNKVFVAVVDCTGHGVPGAFMSMIGNTLLNEVVNEQKVHEPAKVLDALNEKVKFTLNQDAEDKEGFSEDGMDISLCCYDKSSNTLELSLANHSACLYVNGERQVIEGDIYSIGGNVGIEGVSFNNNKIQLASDVTLYMFSDGYQDQFGGENNKKFMTGRFYTLLDELQQEEFNKQNSILEKTFDDWKANEKQVDDVLVIGMRFPKV